MYQISSPLKTSKTKGFDQKKEEPRKNRLQLQRTATLFLRVIQRDLRIFLKAVDRIIAAGVRIYRTRWSFLVAWSQRCRACGPPFLTGRNQPSEGERDRRREIEADRDESEEWKGIREKERRARGRSGKPKWDREREQEKKRQRSNGGPLSGLFSK